MPTKRTVLRKTVAQMRGTIWRSEEAALADLKRSGVKPVTEQWVLRGDRLGVWRLVDVMAESREEKVIEALRKKPGSNGRSAPEVILNAVAPSKGRKKAPAKAAPAAGAVEAPEAVPPAEPPAERPAPPELVLEPAPEVPASPYAPLPTADGPYEIILRSADGTFNDNAAVTYAISVSRRLRCNAVIRNGKGITVREIDVAKITAAQRLLGGRGRPRNTGRPKATGKSAEAAKLLMRPNGATFQEVQKITEWGISERFVRRLGRAHRCEPEQLGEKHWRLIKPGNAA